MFYITCFGFLNISLLGYSEGLFFRCQIYSVKIYGHLYFKFLAINLHKVQKYYLWGIFVFENFDHCLSG